MSWLPFPRNCLLSATRESLYPRNITFMGVIEISIKNHEKWRQNKRISPKFHAIAKVYTRKISERHHSRKFIPAKVNFGTRRSRKSIPAKVSTLFFFIRTSKCRPRLGCSNFDSHFLKFSSDPCPKYKRKIKTTDTPYLIRIT